jgi:hypothetical protein
MRPWGAYTVLAEGDGFKVKTIEVRPEQRLSYQRHAGRAAGRSGAPPNRSATGHGEPGGRRA